MHSDVHFAYMPKDVSCVTIVKDVPMSTVRSADSTVHGNIYEAFQTYGALDYKIPNFDELIVDDCLISENITYTPCRVATYIDGLKVTLSDRYARFNCKKELISFLSSYNKYKQDDNGIVTYKAGIGYNAVRSYLTTRCVDFDDYTPLDHQERFTFRVPDVKDEVRQCDTILFDTLPNPDLSKTINCCGVEFMLAEEMFYLCMCGMLFDTYTGDLCSDLKVVRSIEDFTRFSSDFLGLFDVTVTARLILHKY